jgi:hypothetical protein
MHFFPEAFIVPVFFHLCYLPMLGVAQQSTTRLLFQAPSRYASEFIVSASRCAKNKTYQVMFSNP